MKQNQHFAPMGPYSSEELAKAIPAALCLQPGAVWPHETSAQQGHQALAVQVNPGIPLL